MKILLKGSREEKFRRVEIPAKSDIKSIITKSKTNNQTVIIKLNGEIASEKAKLSQGDKLELLGIIYGG